MIHGVNRIIKCGIWQPVKFQIVSQNWIKNEMIFYHISELTLATLIQPCDRKSFHFKNERLTVKCHILIYQGLSWHIWAYSIRSIFVNPLGCWFSVSRNQPAGTQYWDNIESTSATSTLIMRRCINPWNRMCPLHGTLALKQIKAPITTAADILKYLFLFFDNKKKKKVLKFHVIRLIHMKSRLIFLWNIKKTNIYIQCRLP